MVAAPRRSRALLVRNGRRVSPRECPCRSPQIYPRTVYHRGKSNPRVRAISSVPSACRSRLSETMAARSRPSDIDRLSEAMKNLQRSLICSICLELMTEPTKTRCGHSFCKSCILSVLRSKSVSCPLCNMSLNRRNISKDDHLQICIEKFKGLVIAIQIDSHIDILSHLKQPYDTKESCSFTGVTQSSRDSKEKSSKKEKSIHQLNQNVNKQTDNSSTSHGTMIDCNNPRNDLNVSKEKTETLSSLSRAHASSGDENDNAIHSPPDIKIRTWLHSFPDKPSTDDWIAENEMPIEDKARSMNPISDDNSKSDETGEVYHDGIDASRRPSQDRKRSTDCPKRIDEVDTLSQVNKRARQIGEAIEIDSAVSGLKYNASHARIRGKKRCEKVARSKSDIEETVNQGNSSSTIANDTVSVPSSLSTTNTSTITEQSTTNWSRMIEFGKEMKRARKRKVKKLNVSTEKNKIIETNNTPRIVENIKLSPNSRYDSARIATTYNENEKEANISNQFESNDRKQYATDKSLDLSDAKMKSLDEANSQTELYDMDKTDSLKKTYSMMNISHVTLEEGRKIHIMNLNNDQVSKIIGVKNAAEGSQSRRREENAADYRDSSLSPRKRLTVRTPEKLNESVHEIIRDISQTSADNFRSSSCLPAEKRTRETSNVQGTSSGDASSQFPTPNKSRLSLRRKPETGNNKNVDSPTLSQLPLSYRISIDKHEKDIGDRKSVDSPVSMDGELFDRLKAVRRDLNFKIIHEDQQRTDQDTISASTRLKSTFEVEDNDGNVSRIVCQDGKFSRNFTGESTVSKKSVLRKSRSVENQEQRSPVKFIQLGSLMGSLIRQRNVKYSFLGTTKREMSMPAEVRVTPVYNMQKSISTSEVHIATSVNPWNDSQDSSNTTAVENICFANNSNQTVSKEFPAASPICKASATSTPERDMDSHLNQKKSATIVRSSNANQRSDKSIEKSALSLHKVSRADKSGTRGTISHTRPGTSNSIKLLSPDKDSQLKFLQIDSPMSEREELRRASSIKSAIKGNNFSEMESSRLAASMLDKAQQPLIENPCKKRKKMRYASDRELFEDGSNDGNDDSNDSISDSISSQTTIKIDRYSKLFKKTRSSRLNANKKRRLSFPDDQDVDVIPSVSKEQEAPGKRLSSSGSESESATHVMKNLKRYSNDQCSQRNIASITDTTTKKCPSRQDSDEEDHHIRNIIDKWSNEYDATRKRLTKECKNSQNSVESMRNPPEENSAGHQSSRSSNTLEIEKRKNTKSSQRSSAKESDMFESSSLFNSENLDYILQQQPTKSNANDTSKKIMDSSNDDIINRVLQIDRSRSDPGACRPPDSIPRNDITSKRERDSKEYLLQDNFDEIIASVEQPQSEDFILCSEQPDHNPNRPLAKQKTSNCLAMTNESCGAMQETPIIPPSSTNDMFEYYSPKNVRKSPTTNTISRNADKENVACSQKRHGYVDDQRDRKDATANADAIDKDSRKKIVSYNISREKEKFLEGRNASIQSAGRLHVDDGETQKATIAGNRSNSKDDTFEHDSLMNITQYQAQLQMFEEDLFGTAARNQTKATKMISQDDPFPKEQRTPRKRKQNTQDKNTEPGERSADEDDVVENTPEKKMKNSGNNVKTIESRENTKIRFLSPIPKTFERTPSTSGLGQIGRSFLSGANTPTNPFGVHPTSQSTPIIAHNSISMISRPNVFGGSKRSERIESGSILLAKQVDTKTLENVRRLPDKRDLCFVCSGLSAVQITTVKEFAVKYNANYVNQFDRNVTHVIVKTIGEQNAAKSTLKYLQGIAHGKWIVSYRWIEDSIGQPKLLDELPYEATTQNDVGMNGAGPRNSRLREKGLFDGFTFLCVGPYDNVTLGQYQDLLLATGATVVDSFDVLAKMGGMKGIVIQDNIHDDKAIEHWYRTAKAAPILVDWIVECIGQYKLFKLAPYILCLSPQDFCAIGYPRELVEEDEEYNDDE